MLTRITQEILKLLSASASHASPEPEVPQDLEANGIAFANQASLWSPTPIRTPAPPVPPAPTLPPPTSQCATLEPQAHSLEAQQLYNAQRARAAASPSQPECPRASPVLRPPGRTWSFPDT